MFFSLVHGAGDAVGLERVDAFGTLVAQGIKAKGHAMQQRAHTCIDSRGQNVTRGGKTRNGKPDTSQQAARHLARKGGAARDLAGVIGLMCDQPLARQPCGQQQDTKRRQVQHKASGTITESCESQRKRCQKQQVDASARACPSCTLKSAFRCGLCRAGVVFVRTVLAAKALGHQTPPAIATYRMSTISKANDSFCKPVPDMTFP